MAGRVPSRPQRWAVGGLLFAALIGSVIWFAVQSPPAARGPDVGPGPAPGLDPEAARRLIELRNVGIANLENAANEGRLYASAIESFEQLVAALPHEPLGLTNLLIARLLAAEGEADPDRRRALLESADAALENLLQLTPEAAVAHRLAARLAELHGDTAAAFEALARAADLAPDEPVFHYELNVVAESLPPGDQRLKRSRTAVARAYDLEPDNLIVLFEQLGEQAEAEDPAIRTTLAGARKTLRPFADRYRAYNRELDAVIDEALAAVDAGNWRAASLRPLQNLTLPEVAWGIDSRRIKPHLLEFVVSDFSEDFYQRSGLPAETAAPAVPVRFAAAAAQPADLAGTKAIKLADFDLDGLLDIIAVYEDRVEVHGRSAADGPWQLLASAELPRRKWPLLLATFAWQLLASVDLPRPMHGVIAVDIDRDDKENPNRQQYDVINQTPITPPCIDADVDLVLFGPGGLLVYRNTLDQASGQRSLELMPQDQAFGNVRDVITAAAADVDHDGDLDLIVSSRGGLSIWSNRDNFTFEDISSRSALPPDSLNATSVLPVDWDRTVTLDAILAGPATGVLENVLHGRLRWREFTRDFDLFAGARSIAVVNADANGSWELLAGGPQGIVRAATRTPFPGVVRIADVERLSEDPVSGLTTLDYDNDGHLDIVAWTGERIDFYRGRPGGRFERQEGLADDPPSPIIALHPGDVDRDGDVDLLVHTPERVVWLSNAGGNTNNWIDLAIRADPDKSPQRRSERTNVHGLGSLLELKAGTLYQPRVVREQWTHFGLGKLARADAVRVLWTNGIPHNVLEPLRNQTICEQQHLIGSCPYLYTWTGSRYEFLTDCLWAAPIGLQLAEGVLAPMREWEYLKVPGEQLVPIDGEYRLQITEELWEAGYFDHVRLIAIDHPADVEVYSNEKVGPAEIAGFQVHTVRQSRFPVSARDQRGRDVSERLRERDGVFLRSFETWFKQGLTEEHFLELDLGELHNPQRITLFLTGWIFPTDSSINVSLSQNPELDPPQPPSVWVPDENGEWRNVIPYMGFPGGKTKTIAVDLSDAFLTDDYRVRIATTMEICWDDVFFTVDEQPAEVRLTPIAPAAADLHFRGFSAIVPHGGEAPDTYDYAAVSTEPRWPPMQGRFTRYGDVSELVQVEDDRLVVLAPGDELTVRFRVPDDPPPAGWKRDFFLHNVGWDKDANLNTITGQTAGPLPFRSMTQYPPGPDDVPPDSPEYREYLRTYQTREQNAAVFWRQMQPER